MRPGVKFHDGWDLDANNVVASYGGHSGTLPARCTWAASGDFTYFSRPTSPCYSRTLPEAPAQ